MWRRRLRVRAQAMIVVRPPTVAAPELAWSQEVDDVFPWPTPRRRAAIIVPAVFRGGSFLRSSEVVFVGKCGARELNVNSLPIVV